MRSVCATIASLLFAATATACFTEAPIDDDPTATSEGGTCTPGALGCECYGNGTCDPALECAAATGTCVPAGCSLGEVHCLCDHGSCDEPLLCIAGMCAAPSDSSGTADDSSTDSPSTTNAETSTTNTTTTTASTSDPSTSTGESEESESESSSTTEGLPDCGELMCDACIDCVSDRGQPCDDETDACVGAPGCGEAAELMLGCAEFGFDCDENSCAGANETAKDLAQALHQCRVDQCTTPCGALNQPMCV
ncbi:MAG TPA: hypothetical protein VG755_29945 [Nannocystaceae bacterium]|nr:hypothetical protein [Nannocystaceae bacterium]